MCVTVRDVKIVPAHTLRIGDRLAYGRVTAIRHAQGVVQATIGSTGVVKYGPGETVQVLDRA